MEKRTRSLVMLLVGSLLTSSLVQADSFNYKQWITDKWNNTQTKCNAIKESENYKKALQFRDQWRDYKKAEPRAQKAENFAQVGVASIGMIFGGNKVWQKLTHPQKQSKFRPLSILAYLGLTGYSFNLLRNGFKKMEHTDKQIRCQNAIQVLEEATSADKKQPKMTTAPSTSTSDSNSNSK